MTVQQEIPLVVYTATGVGTDYAFNWSSGQRNETKVQIDGVIAAPGGEYQITNYDEGFGGIVVIDPALELNTQVRIYRETPITQETQYVEGQPFPVDTHEFTMDKDCRILQELVFGNRALGADVDLSTGLGPDYVDIINSIGEDARIPSWHCTQELAGVFHGIVTDSAPIDGSSTSKPDGFVWYEVAP